MLKNKVAYAIGKSKVILFEDESGFASIVPFNDVDWNIEDFFVKTDKFQNGQGVYVKIFNKAWIPGSAAPVSYSRFYRLDLISTA